MFVIQKSRPSGNAGGIGGGGIGTELTGEGPKNVLPSSGADTIHIGHDGVASSHVRDMICGRGTFVSLYRAYLVTNVTAPILRAS